MTKLRDIVDAMTPGPWSKFLDDLGEWQVVMNSRRFNGQFVTWKAFADESDIEGCIKLRNIAPELLAVVDAARFVVPETCCTCNTQDDCGRCKLLGTLDALDAKLETP